MSSYITNHPESLPYLAPPHVAPRHFGVHQLLLAGAVSLLLFSPLRRWPCASRGTPIRIDASQPWREPAPARYDEGARPLPPDAHSA